MSTDADLKKALADMHSAHEALTFAVTPHTLKLFEEAVAAARVAFESHVVESFRKARVKWPR